MHGRNAYIKSNEEKLRKKLATSFQKNIFTRKIAKVDENGE